jgi:predicted outer membrane repeat protein
MKKTILLTSIALSLNAQTFNVSDSSELREALVNASINGEQDTIILADGTYMTTDDGKGTFEYLDTEIYDLTLRGSSAKNVVLSGDKENRIFRYQSTPDSKLTVENISFIDGGPEIDSYGSRSQDGGAIYSTGDIDVTDCIFDNNHAREGGGIYSKKNIKLERTTFIDNSASSRGGGFYGFSATVMDSNFTKNSSADYSYGGGGFYSNSVDIVENSIFNNNITTDNNGGGFYASVKQIKNCTFTNNSAKNYGGGFSGGSPIVENTTFYKNSAKIGGGFDASSVTVIKSTFTENIAQSSDSSVGYGAGFNANSAIVQNSVFHANNTGGDGGGFRTNSSSTVVNSIFTKNIAKGLGAGFHAGHLFLSNSIIADNSDGVYLSGANDTSNPQVIKNSVFINNYIKDTSAEPRSDISGVETAIATIKNNYLDTDNINVQKLESNNIFDGVNLGFVDATNRNYNITALSDLIDAGVNDFSDKFIISEINYLAEDFNNNKRVVGTTIDIGVHEYSTGKPTINSFTFSGVTKEFQELTFLVDYTLAEGKTIQDVSFDYLNDGSFTSNEKHKYQKAKKYTVKVKVTDSNGEFSIMSMELKISPLSFSDMTNDQKLKMAILPEYYDQIMDIFESEKVMMALRSEKNMFKII